MTWQANNLDKNKHCFCGSSGGFSKGKYLSLNANTKSYDDKDCLYKNLQAIAQKVGLEKENLVLLNQGVSDRAVYIGEASWDNVVADGIVTTKKGIGLCIRTADCAPVLFEDRKSGVIGAAHAGWRGAFKGIMENVINLMIEKGAKLENIKAAIGPCVMQKSYEVDINFYNQFLEQNIANKKYFIDGKRKGYFLFDLPTYCLDRLKKAGIKNIEVSFLDTYSLEDEYFSFRRFTHRGLVGEPRDFPNQVSIITL